MKTAVYKEARQFADDCIADAKGCNDDVLFEIEERLFDLIADHIHSAMFVKRNGWKFRAVNMDNDANLYGVDVEYTPKQDGAEPAIKLDTLKQIPDVNFVDWVMEV